MFGQKFTNTNEMLQYVILRYADFAPANLRQLNTAVATVIRALTRMPDQVDHENFTTKSARGKGARTRKKAQPRAEIGG
jgi:hypothetical protein